MPSLTTILDTDNTCPVFVCADCMTTQRHGVLVDRGEDYADQPFPWSAVRGDPSVLMETPGLLSIAHLWCEDPQECRDDLAVTGTGCEYVCYSTTPCDGCGSMLAGSRYAYTLWLTYVPPSTWDRRSWWASDVTW